MITLGDNLIIVAACIGVFFVMLVMIGVAINVAGWWLDRIEAKKARGKAAERMWRVIK